MNSISLGSVMLKPKGVLEVTLGDGKTRVVMPDLADDALMVVRVTPDRDGTAPLLSVCVFNPDTLPAEEPYLYHNADSFGKTSLRQRWHAVCKAPVDGAIAVVNVRAEAPIVSGEFRIGQSFRSVTTPNVLKK